MKRLRKALLLVLLSASQGVSAAQNQDKAELALRAARDKEVLDGNLKAAIEQYRKIAVDYRMNRKVVAEALVHMGQCYEKLGDAEARSAYERVVREFGDQKEAADEARKHLTGKAPASGIAVAARLALKLESGYITNISRDGRYAAAANEKAVLLYDLVKGGERRIVGARERGESFNNALISPDGKQIAYARMTPSRTELYVSSVDGLNPRRLASAKAGQYMWTAGISPDGNTIAYVKSTQMPITNEVYLVGADGTNSRVIVAGVEGEYCEGVSWSSDGKHVLVNRWRKDQGDRMLLASVNDDPATREIPMAGSGSFSPDGKYIAFTRNLQGKSLSGELQDGILVVPVAGGKEVRLYPGSLGSTWDVYWMPDSKGLLFHTKRPQQYATDQWDVYSLRFVDGIPGGATGKHTAAPELVKSDLSGYPVAYTQGGDYYYVVRTGPRNGPERDIFDVEIDPATGKRISEPKAITSQVVSPTAMKLGPALSPDGQSLAYVANDKALVIRSVKSGEERLVEVPVLAKSDPSRQISDRLQWFPDNRSLLLYYGSGELYRFDSQTGQSRRLLDTVRIPWYINTTPTCPPGCAQNGWATSLLLAPDGRTIFYRDPASRNRMLRRDLNGGPEQEVCRVKAPHINNFALSADGATLALIGVGAWDAAERAIMTVAATGGEPKEIYRSGTADVARDLTWSRDGRYLIFSMPKWDNRFVGDLFSIPAEGGRPQPLGIQLSPYDFLNISPDGRHLIFMGKSPRNEKKELWVMKVPQH